jgi:hypothetical protein
LAATNFAKDFSVDGSAEGWGAGGREAIPGKVLSGFPPGLRDCNTFDHVTVSLQQ